MNRPLLTIAATIGFLATSINAAAAPPRGARTVSEHSALYEFDYAYPAQATAFPPLRAWLDADLANSRSRLARDARQARDEARESGFPYNTYAFSRQWAVVADVPGWLSLSSRFFFYSGGAHPNHGSGGVVWDKAAGVRRKAVDLFVSPAAFTRAVQRPFCDALDRERARRRGAPVDRKGGGLFDDCLDPAELTVLLGSSNRRQFDRIGILADPYAAGSYAEGDYEITLPVTPAMLAAVKPQYRRAFAAVR